MARLIGEAVGRKVRHVDVPVPALMRALRVQAVRFALDDFLQAQIAWFAEETRFGTWDAGGVTTHVRDLSGVEPEDFGSITRRYLARDERARRTIGNYLRVLWNGLLMAVTPGIDVARLERVQQHPSPPNPEMSGASERWAEEHAVKRPPRVASVRTMTARGAT